MKEILLNIVWFDYKRLCSCSAIAKDFSEVPIVM